MTWEYWLIAISVAVIALAFVVLVIYLAFALRAMKQIVNDLDQKVHAFDPLFRVVSNAGNVIEKKAAKHLEEAEDALIEEKERKKCAVNTAIEVTEWALLGLALWQKFQEKRR